MTLEPSLVIDQKSTWIEVGMDSMMSAKSPDILYTYGLGPCIGLAALDRSDNSGLLAHRIELDSIMLFFDALKNKDPQKLEIAVAGGYAINNMIAKSKDNHWAEIIRNVSSINPRKASYFKGNRDKDVYAIKVDCLDGEIKVVNGMLAGADLVKDGYYANRLLSF